jgi:tRNA (adenine37-N6)-methyltransferase
MLLEQKFSAQQKNKKLLMEFTVKPIAFVKNSRREISDDNWGSIVSEITLVPELPASVLDGIEEFSHLEIIFLFDKINESDVVFTSAHPRENPAWPKVGIFAQRKKNRPNRLGLCTVKFLNKKENKIIVAGLDAIDGTPVLDIKPVMKEFLPGEEIHQPAWVSELMKNYW